jgi:hypothetical protein
MSKKSYEVDSIASDLAASRFFQPPPEAQAQSEPAKARRPRRPRNLGTYKPRNLGNEQPALSPSDGFDINERPVKQDNYMFTMRELDALEDLKIELSRQLDRRISKQDIARIAVHAIAEDYRKRGEQSELYLRAQKKKG